MLVPLTTQDFLARGATVYRLAQLVLTVSSYWCGDP